MVINWGCSWLPNYDFQCKECQHRFAETVALKEKDNVRCPLCGGEVRQLFTGFGLLKAAGGGNSCTAPSGSRFT